MHGSLQCHCSPLVNGRSSMHVAACIEASHDLHQLQATVAAINGCYSQAAMDSGITCPTRQQQYARKARCEMLAQCKGEQRAYVGSQQSQAGGRGLLGLLTGHMQHLHKIASLPGHTNVSRLHSLAACLKRLLPCCR